MIILSLISLLVSILVDHLNSNLINPSFSHPIEPEIIIMSSDQVLSYFLLVSLNHNYLTMILSSVI